MTVPKKLIASLKVASIFITPDGELPAGSRKDIILLIEELSSFESADAGYLRRARLALICAREVLGYIGPYWRYSEGRLTPKTTAYPIY